MLSETERAQTPQYEIRSLRERDLDELVRIDARSFGRPRPVYLKLKLKNALEDTSLRISLAAEKDGMLVGFLMGSVFYGDYGQPEPVATLEVINVLPEFARQGVASLLWQQFVRNVKGMRVARIQTQVDWTDGEILAFMRHSGFTPSARLCLERVLDFETDD